MGDGKEEKQRSQLGTGCSRRSEESRMNTVKQERKDERKGK